MYKNLDSFYSFIAFMPNKKIMKINYSTVSLVLLWLFWLILPNFSCAQVQLELQEKNIIIERMPGSDTSFHRFVSGRVIDQAQGKKALKAVLAIKGTNIVSYSNDDGYYTIDYSQVSKSLERIIVVATCTGYTDKETELMEAYMLNATLNIELKRSGNKN